MRRKKCKKCGKVFETDRLGAYLCPDCALASKRDSLYRERTCIDCGVKYIGHPKTKRCPTCQDAVNKARAAAARKNGPARPIGSIAICECCGEKYQVNSGAQRYCKDCAKSAVRENIRAHKRKYNADNKERFYPLKEENRSYNKVCIICGKVFDDGTASVTCSPECDRERRRIRRNETDIRRGRRKIPAEARYDSGLPKSGVTGVTYAYKGKWQAIYKQHYIGVYDTIDEAAKAIEKYKNQLKESV